MSLTTSKENPREQSLFPVVHLCAGYTAEGSSARQPAGHQTNCLRLLPWNVAPGFILFHHEVAAGSTVHRGLFPSPALPPLS